MKHVKSETSTVHKVKVEGDEAETLVTEEQPVANELEVATKALEELQTKYNQLNDTYLRTLAEFDNYRKRSLREKADLIKSGGESVLVNILTVVDDMERGLAAMKETQDVEAVKEGMDLIYDKLQNFLKQNGVTVIETEGKDFDTDHHEAITTFPAPTPELKGKVVDCVQKGYILNEKVIRFAKVVVGE
ncbi:MAG TPA: nucleotide exchange factor GrpE [Bacteroidales bacterium]|nr:nucleotide exchange factor GrpE [Bacteroidales bacterium]